MENCKTGDVPVVKDDKLSLDLCPKNDLEKEYMKDVPYLSVVGSLMYAQVCTRPNIAFIVNALGRYQSNPGRSHCVATKKVMRYLKKTRDYMLVYKKVDDLEVIGYSDSDYGGCPDDLRSTSGFIFMLAGGAISWKSVKQTLTASSTVQAEFVACYGAATQASWLKIFISGLVIVDSISRPLKIYCDNRAAVFYSKNNKSSSVSKHMEIKYLVVRDMVKGKDIVIEHISTDLMLADPLTKGLRPVVFKQHVDNMGVVESFDLLG
ncbi:secreted RxLR effector protein 161-like [Lycium barbarum]|uniref:secreted RxLR effector protein 161-like n=1 Tax=Lycium barbarum TaxID=112863 RepID=UPI00293F2E92|nr:secreted RxLR effector protein 161-like [Lycium barbarum]